MLCFTDNSIRHQSFVYTYLNDQTVLFQAIQFSKNNLFARSFNVKLFYSTHWLNPIRCSTLGPSGPGSDEGVLCIRQCSSITGASPSDFSVRVLLLCRDVVGVFYNPSRLDWKEKRNDKQEEFKKEEKKWFVEYLEQQKMEKG